MSQSDLVARQEVNDRMKVIKLTTNGPVPSRN